MEPTTILSLNDDCLCNIVSFISDRSSFNSFARACTRFQRVTNLSRNYHINILRWKAEYYIKHFIVHLGNRYVKRDSSGVYEEYQAIKELLNKAVQCSIAKRFLTYDKFVDVWRESGPVASEIFSWFRNQSSSVTQEGPRATCSTEYKSFTIHLPTCDQEMIVNTSYFVDYIGNYDREITINVECGDLKIEEINLTDMIPGDYEYWSEEEVRSLVEPMKPVTELLQKELGETIPSIRANFLVWFLFFFPCGGSLKEEDKLIFKDFAKNEKPKLESIQPLLELYKKNISEINFQNSLSRWINTTKTSEQEWKPIVETLDILVLKSDAPFLKGVKSGISRFFNMITSYDLRKLPENLILELIHKTTFKTDNWSAGAIADKHVNNTVYFRLLGSKAMEVNGNMHGDGASYPSWEELKLDFHLPDDSKVHLDSGYYGDKIPLDVEKVSPVTKLLQDCINQTWQGDEGNIPQITNIFTVVYFMHALHFGGETETFLLKSNESDLIVKEETDESEESYSDET